MSFVLVQPATRRWIVGSSIVHWAETAARSKSSLWPELLTTGVRWLGERGMGWARLRPKLRHLVGREVTPAAIIVHLGSNDLGSMSLKALIGWAKTEIDWLMATFPSAVIIWSDILARQRYRGAVSQKGMEACRKTYNSALRSYVKGKGGKVIRHHGIQWNTDGIFRDDGVHMNDDGNVLLNSDFQGALMAFRVNAEKIEYP